MHISKDNVEMAYAFNYCSGVLYSYLVIYLQYVNEFKIENIINILNVNWKVLKSNNKSKFDCVPHEKLFLKSHLSEMISPTEII